MLQGLRHMIERGCKAQAQRARARAPFKRMKRGELIADHRPDESAAGAPPGLASLPYRRAGFGTSGASSSTPSVVPLRSSADVSGSLGFLLPHKIWPRSTQTILCLTTENMDSHLSLGAASLTVVLAALACHAVFKRWEPTNLWALIALLVFVPASISVLFTPSYGYAPSLALSFSVYLTTLATSIVAYRLSPMHPLARYPGPTMFKVSKWCSVWIARGGKQHLYIHNLHEQYGDVIRIGARYQAHFVFLADALVLSYF
ncbi:hypothetical protein NM688_g9246 [Phlebia brevispora]|uniref:Uncharacterized protein n=1 Tax=Phlebia brevispora TaxID=194682 RepID=A0ACC1RM06_9APHY|nr:hypothetical protein NM688_g9246 [Phlebia brevispora]